MGLISYLSEKYQDNQSPLIIFENNKIHFKDILKAKTLDLSLIKPGDVVALIGDYDPNTINIFLRLIEIKAIIVPLTINTRAMHDYFFNEACVQYIIEKNNLLKHKINKKNKTLEQFKLKGNPGFIAFSSGTSGAAKAILHDFTIFLKKFEVPRPKMVTINFLLFDHVGGLNTLFHTIYNNGTIVVPYNRSVENILNLCSKYHVELLPTTPTFLRIMLMSGSIPSKISKSLKIITYGTELMDPSTLKELTSLLPLIDFRQTYGVSELGVFKVKSKSRDSLYFKIVDKEIETKIEKNILKIRSSNKMIGYLNSVSPFDNEGWYNTKDIVEERDGYYRVTGRTSEVINVGGLKFMASEVERVVLQYENVELVKAEAKSNPITGQHVELTVQSATNNKLDKTGLKKFLIEQLPKHMMPKRIKVASVSVGHRFKRA